MFTWLRVPSAVPALYARKLSTQSQKGGSQNIAWGFGTMNRKNV
jgi:hypothetical protein